ncbi:MAG: 50S ribosomal protein L29 [Chloroflexota bacterium]|nr:50S ribosomal protein L29 [Chloroflexota bacterium]
MTRINRKAEEIRRLSDGDLAKELEETHRRLFSLRLQWMTRQVTNYRELTQVRRRIARLKSIQKQRQLAPTKVGAAKKE